MTEYPSPNREIGDNPVFDLCQKPVSAECADSFLRRIKAAAAVRAGYLCDRECRIDFGCGIMLHRHGGHFIFGHNCLVVVIEVFQIYRDHSLYLFCAGYGSNAFNTFYTDCTAIFDIDGNALENYGWQQYQGKVSVASGS